jgi:hypothetical protein
VNEDVGSTTQGFNESKSFAVAEPLNRPFFHF